MRTGTMKTYKWSPITDLPIDWEALCSKELPVLVKVWEEQKDRLHESKA